MRRALGGSITAVLLAILSGCSSSAGPCGSGECVAAEGSALATTNDLTIGYIQRLPVLSWVQGSTNPKREGWPAVGQSVTWRGFVKNFSSSARNNIQYKWFVDGAQVATGQVSVGANGTASVDFARAWDFSRHTLRLSIDTNNVVAEDEEQNNDVSVYTDAISLGLWVERGLYDYFLAHQRELVGAHSTSWENWAQRQVTRWNDVLFAGAIYGDTPNGVLDRIRLDKITIVPDGSLPLSGGVATNDPDLNDHTVDLEWGYPANLISGYSNTTSATLDNAFFYEQSLIHELGHARYLVDNYGFNVHQQPDGHGRDGIPQTENGVGIVGTPFLPMLSSDAVYYNHQLGLMNGDYGFMDDYGARALNLIAAARATQGNANAPGNFGAFLNDLPTQNQLTLLDASTGSPLAGAEVRVYQSTGNGQLYGKNFSNTPAQTLTTDAGGKVLLGHNPFTSGSLTPWHDNTDILLRVKQQNRVRYVFMEASDFNQEFWRGHTTQGSYTLNVAFLAGGVINQNPVLGFESTSSWSTTSGQLASVSSPITEGAAALQISGFNYANLTSTPLSSQTVSIGSSVAFDVLLPALQPSSWHGQAQVYLSSPSRGVFNAYLGSKDLTGLPLESYNTVTLAIPASVRTNLQAGAFSDLTVSIVLNVQSGSGRHLLDNFRFLP